MDLIQVFLAELGVSQAASWGASWPFCPYHGRIWLSWTLAVQLLNNIEQVSVKP